MHEACYQASQKLRYQYMYVMRAVTQGLHPSQKSTIKCEQQDDTYVQ